MINRGMFSSARGDWRTPELFYKELNAEFRFTLDPCPPKPTFDGLQIPWTGRVFVNPPYGREIRKWTGKGAAEWDARYPHLTAIVWLVPARTDTAWWQDDLMPRASEIRFIRGRLRFSEYHNSAPFPSAVVVFK